MGYLPGGIQWKEMRVKNYGAGIKQEVKFLSSGLAMKEDLYFWNIKLNIVFSRLIILLRNSFYGLNYISCRLVFQTITYI